MNNAGGGVWNGPASVKLLSITLPTASINPTVSGSHTSGLSSMTLNTVVVRRNPGRQAMRTDATSVCVHSRVVSGQRPEIRIPRSSPWRWNGVSPMGIDPDRDISWPVASSLMVTSCCRKFLCSGRL